MDTPIIHESDFTDACLRTILDTLIQEKENGREVVFLIGHGSMEAEIFQKLQEILPEGFVAKHIDTSVGDVRRQCGIVLSGDRSFDRYTVNDAELFFEQADINLTPIQPVPLEFTATFSTVWDEIAFDVIKSNNKRKIPRSERIPHLERGGYDRRIK